MKVQPIKQYISFKNNNSNNTQKTKISKTNNEYQQTNILAQNSITNSIKAGIKIHKNNAVIFGSKEPETKSPFYEHIINIGQAIKTLAQNENYFNPEYEKSREILNQETNALRNTINNEMPKMYDLYNQIWQMPFDTINPTTKHSSIEDITKIKYEEAVKLAQQGDEIAPDGTILKQAVKNKDGKIIKMKEYRPDGSLYSEIIFLEPDKAIIKEGIKTLSDGTVSIDKCSFPSRMSVFQTYSMPDDTIYTNKPYWRIGPITIGCTDIIEGLKIHPDGLCEEKRSIHSNTYFEGLKRKTNSMEDVYKFDISMPFQCDKMWQEYEAKISQNHHRFLIYATEYEQDTEHARKQKADEFCIIRINHFGNYSLEKYAIGYKADFNEEKYMYSDKFFDFDNGKYGLPKRYIENYKDNSETGRITFDAFIENENRWYQI